jgi:peptidyl-prolyl cis-trans isomerase SurA
MMTRSLAAAALTVALVTSAGAPPAAQAQPAQRDRAASPIILDRVVAVVNDAVILQSELRTRTAPMVADLDAIEDPRERERRATQIERQVLEEMVNEEIIVQTARESQIEVTEKEVKAALDEIKSQNNLDDAGLAQALAMQGYTMASYREDVRRQILRMRAVNMLVRPRVTVTDEDVRGRYDAMSRRSSAVSKVRLHHVVVALPDKPTQDEVAAAKARAAEVVQRAKGGESFADLAAAYSDDEGTAEAGGEIGWIERGSIATEWEVIVFAMEKGEVRGPISGPSGLHVFYVSDIEQSELQPFEALKEQIRNDLYSREMDRQTVLWLEELRRKAHVELRI